MLGVAAGPAAAQTTLVFGSYTSEQPSALVDQLRPALDLVAQRLSEELRTGVTIRMQIMRSYEEGVKLIVERRANFMRVGGQSQAASSGPSASSSGVIAPPLGRQRPIEVL